MKDYKSDQVRNVVLLGHRGAGKTSVVESILYYNKLTDRLGNPAEYDGFAINMVKTDNAASYLVKLQ